MDDHHAELTPEQCADPRIIVVGVGGAGGNAVNNMIQGELSGVEFLVANTDAQALSQSRCGRRIRLGQNLTQGLGAGSKPEIGRVAAEEALEDIVEALAGAQMVFITAGMGGGTGTGAAPVIARAARAAGALTVGVVTKPFLFEGVRRMRLAEAGIQEISHYVDTLITIPNQNLLQVVGEDTTFTQAFKMVDQVLHLGVREVTDLVLMPGLINLDFADVRAVMSGMGRAIMGSGEADGEDRAIVATEAALFNPLIDNVSITGAPKVLINITGGEDLTIGEIDRAASRIHEEVDQEATIIFGSTFDQRLDGRMRVSVFATKIDSAASRPVQEAGIPDQLLAAQVTRTAKSLAISANATLGTEDHHRRLHGAGVESRKTAANGAMPGRGGAEVAPKPNESPGVRADIRTPDFAPGKGAQGVEDSPEIDEFLAVRGANSGKIDFERTDRSGLPDAGPPQATMPLCAESAVQPAKGFATPLPPLCLDPSDRIASDTHTGEHLNVPSFLRRRD